jgi:hypothetical protein
MDIEFNEPEAPDFEERKIDPSRRPADRKTTEQKPEPPAHGRTPGSAEGERDADEQSR